MNQPVRKHRLAPSVPRPPLRVLAVGDVGHPDFAEAIATLEGDSELHLLSPSTSTAPPWDLLLVCQARPGSLDPEALLDWRTRHPLAGKFVLLGSWCEGETRTGKPLPGLARLFWYQFPSWWRLTREAWNVGRPTEWHWPFRQVATLAEHPAEGEFVAVVSPDYASGSTLVDLCRSTGRTANWYPSGGSWQAMASLSAAIWSGGMLDAAEEGSLRSTRQSLPPDAPLVVLLDFPRREAVARAKEIGATTVLGKPWRADHVLSALERRAPEVSVGAQEVA